MFLTWSMLALAAGAGVSSARAAVCENINEYLNIPDPMEGDMEIVLDDVDTIACPEFDDSDGMEEVIISGGTLTLKSANNVRFVNFGFTVKSGAHLVFDMPKTKFGPNSTGYHRANYRDSTVEIEDGASATFLGRVVAKEVANVYSLFHNQGTLEVKKMASFEDGSNVFRTNTGTVKFRGITSFKRNKYLAVQNDGDGFVRFSKDVFFDDNAFQFDGASGCSVSNQDSTGKIVFRGDVVISNNDCSEGLAVYNAGTMNFYGKAFFDSNEGNSYNGGAVYNRGSMKFKRAVKFYDNTVQGGYGGGIATNGGDVTFSKSVTFQGNSADSGAAFAVAGSGLLTFEKPSVVRFREGVVFNEEDDSCLYGEVEAGSTVIGFPFDDVCGPSES